MPRSGHVVSIKVNGQETPVSMTLDSEGRGYFSKNAKNGRKKQYRFWSALFGVRDPAAKHKTTTATNSQLSDLELRPGWIQFFISYLSTSLSWNTSLDLMFQNFVVVVTIDFFKKMNLPLCNFLIASILFQAKTVLNTRL